MERSPLQAAQRIVAAAVTSVLKALAAGPRSQLGALPGSLPLATNLEAASVADGRGASWLKARIHALGDLSLQAACITAPAPSIATRAVPGFRYPSFAMVKRAEGQSASRV